MAKAPINVSIAGDYNDKDINRAIRDLNSLKTGGGDTSKSMSGLSDGMKKLGGVIAATFTIGLITDFFSNSIAGALADEKAMKSLEIALGNVGAAHAVAPVEAFIDALARQSGVADDVLRPSFQRLVTATGDVALSQKNLQLALDISAGTGRDLEAVSLSLAKAFSGNTTALGKLGVGIDASIIKSKDMDAITAALSEKFAGQASAAAETYQGKLNRISVAAGEGTELIGTSLLKAVDDLAESFGGVGGATNAIDTASQAIADFITGAAAGVSPIADFASGINESTGSTFDFADALKLAYPIFIPLINATENLVDAGAALRVGNVQQSKATTKLRDEYISATGAIVGFVAAEFEAEDAVGQTTNAIVTQFTAMSRIDQAMQDAGSRAIFVASADDTLRLAAADAAAATASLGTSSGGAAQASDTLTKAQERVAQKIENTRTKTDAAIQTFTDYRDSVAQSFSGMLDLSAAFETFTTRQTNLAKAQKELTDFQTTIVGEATDSQIKDLAKLQTAYHDASESAAKGSQSVVEEFEAQGRKLAEFGSNLSRLVAAGLGRRAFDAIRGMTAERGAELTASLVGGMISENVNRINSVYDSINTMAIGVGNQGAVAFEQVGFTMATAMIETLLTVVNGRGRARLRAMLDDLNGAMNTAAAGAPMPSSSAGGGSGGDLAGMFTSGAVTVGIPEISGINWAALGLPDPLAGFRAAGGPVSAGRSYMVGEAGPELFTPSRSGSITANSAMGGNTYNINVSAGVGDPRAIGQQIVEYVKKFEKANGPVFVAA